MIRSRRPLARALLLVSLALLLSACQTTRQLRGAPEPSGFLGDYSMLRPGTGDEAQLIYINPRADFSRYNAVILESVTLWRSATQLSAQDEQMLTDHLYAALHAKLEEQGLAIARVPGPHVMRLRAAITEARGSRQVANAVTSIVPQARLLTTVGGMASDTAVFVGKAGLEAEFTNSMTGERLAAGVDERVGTKTIRGAFGEWTHVKQAFDHWAERIAKRMAALRAGG